ncbi:hypothetical protein HDU87_008845 [Geranomyces variabilis]|uniref:WW domain-containing protein n=1 Tax=Geranomyces variabilis TaxID=109894 RepID=A0AAD5TCB5_9FUNG|nr:hypothetical protein HDU87_008845 [Geranomyces variabilis]
MSTLPTKPSAVSGWQPIFDDTSQLYYWWNVKTNETSWADPTLQHSAQAPAQQASSESARSVSPAATESNAGPQPSSYYDSKEYYDWYHANVKSTSSGSAEAQSKPIIGSVQSDYTTIGAFSTRSGRFQNVDRDARFAAPEKYYDQSSKAMRQMGIFFDYEKFQSERAADRMAKGDEASKRRPPTLTKKQVEYYKQKKKLKKLSSVRTRFGGD